MADPIKLRLTATGTRPLMMHNSRLANPFDSYAKELKRLNGKQSKTDEDRLQIARVEFEGGIYFDKDLGPYVPAANVFRSLIGGGRLTKRTGKKIERGVIVDGIEFPLIYKGPRDIESLWAGGESEYVDMSVVVIERRKILRCRPIFRQWAIEADVVLDPTVIDLDVFIEVAMNAGSLEGLGDYRRTYGRYAVKIEQL